MKRIVILFCLVFWACVSKVCAQDEFHFNGTVSPYWSDVDNWQDGLKPEGDHAVVFLHNHVYIDDDVVVDDLLYAADSVIVTIATGYRLTVKGALEPPSAQQLLLDDGARLLCGHAVKATVRKKISSQFGDKEAAAWHFIASPLVGQLHPTDIDSLIPEGSNFELVRFNQSHVGGEWERYEDEAYQSSFLIENGQGYLYANGSEVMVSFVGELLPNDLPVAVDLEYDDASNVTAKGVNLVGNPFACDAYVDKSYYKMNSEGDDFELVRASANKPIVSCSGVMVQATALGQSVNFSRNPWTTDKGCIRLTLKSYDNVIDELIMSFNEGDAIEKFFFKEHEAFLYFQQDGSHYAILTAETLNSTPINFKTMENGNYVLTVTPENVNINSLHLVDNITGADVDLLSTPEYTFSASTSDYYSRFRLFVNTDHGMDENVEMEESFAYYSNGKIVLQDVEGEVVLEVVDLTGRIVKKQKVGGSENVVEIQTSGVYLLRLVNGKAVRTQKLVVW